MAFAPEREDPKSHQAKAEGREVSMCQKTEPRLSLVLTTLEPDTMPHQPLPGGEGFFSCILRVAGALESDLPILQPAGGERGTCFLSPPPSPHPV